jgi:ATP cone domain
VGEGANAGPVGEDPGIVVETSPSQARPAWVYKRDGRLVPFDPDKISQALFAATESLGRPDAFLARELADGVLHFLAAGLEGAIPTTAQIGETVVKVVRELGQPPLAQAFAAFGRQRPRKSPAEFGGISGPGKGDVVLRFSPETSPAAVLDSCLRSYSLQAVFSRDLAAAHQDGLITLTGLETPLQLAAWVLEPHLGRGHSPHAPGALVEAIGQARQWTGQTLALDGPEHGLAPDARGPEELARELAAGLRATGLSAVVNLNHAYPPAWAEHLAEGPLFAGHRQAPPADQLANQADALLEAVLAAGADPDPVRVDWHLGERDLAPAAAGRLVRLARLGLTSPGLAFTFDRPRKGVGLAEGVDRRHPAVLLTVGLHLPRLAELPRLRGDAELFLHKLGSLTRLALSAGAQKRNFLRRQDRGQGGLTRGFLLDRARLVVTPVGLEAAVRTLTGECLGGPGAGPALARKVVQRLREVLRLEGPAYQLDACLDGVDGFALERDRGTGKAGAPLHPSLVAGLTAWDAAAAPRHQLRAAGPLQAADLGTAAVLLPGDRALPAEEAAELLRYAGRHTEVVRLRFVQDAAPGRQLTAPWEAGPE